MKKSVHYIGLDVHKETIAVAIAPGNTAEVRHYGNVGGTLEALDKLIKKLSTQDVELRLVYEAGPCGYVIYRHLKQRGFHCQVVAPSLIPKKASDRVKTDARGEYLRICPDYLNSRSELEAAAAHIAGLIEGERV